MSDDQEVRDLMSRYCWCVDHGQWDEWKDLFTEDAVWTGGGMGPFKGREGLAQQAANLAGRMADNPLRHIAGNLLVEVDADRGRMRSYLTVVRLSTKDLATVGEYEMAVVKAGGRWLIERLEFTRL